MRYTRRIQTTSTKSSTAAARNHRYQALAAKKSEDLDFLRKMRRKDQELYHQIFDRNSEESLTLGSGSSESKDLDLLDLKVVLANIDIVT